MKIQNIYHLLQAALLLLLVSCTQEEFPAVQDKAQQLTISVTDGGYTSAVENMKTRVETRAVENGYTTEFTEGDACGFYMVRGGKPVYSNVKLTAEKDAATGGIMWKTDGTTLAAGMDGESYYLYYPYQADMAGKTATPAEGAVMTDAEFFKPLIDGWQPGDDQSTHTAYTASDLMTAGGSTTGTGNTIHLSFAMKHRMALAIIEMPKTVYKFIDANVPDYTVGAEATFTGTAKPLRMADGTYRYLVHSSMPTIEGCYDGGNREFTITTSASHPVVGEYKRYKVDGAVTTVKDYTMQRGDYLLADGNLLPKGTTLTEEQKASVAAIVFWTPAETNPEGRITPASLDFDKIMVKEHPNCTHGLAVSIKDAPGNVSWQNVNDWVADFQRGTDFNPVDKDEYVNIATGFDATGNINRILGYQNTKVLWAYNGYCKTNGKTDALVNPAEVLKTFIANNPAPANSTGWFLPSVKELHMLCYKDVDNIAYTRDNTETRDIVEVSISAVGGDALSPRNNHKRFWSSSESPSNKNGAFSVYFYNAFAQLSEKDGALNVRAVCAF